MNHGPPLAATAYSKGRSSSPSKRLPRSSTNQKPRSVEGSHLLSLFGLIFGFRQLVKILP